MVVLRRENCHTTRFFLVNKILQHFCTFHSFIRAFPRFLQLVSDTPQNNRRMITVTQQHILHIFLPPFVKIFGIITGFPFIKCLIDYDKSHTVTHIQKFRRGLIMRTADGITPVFLQNLQTAFTTPVGYSCP